MLEYRCSSVDWKPSPVVALATSPDESQVAAAREDGSLEIWLVSPGAVGWHCQLTIHGDPISRISSLAWCHAASKGLPSGSGRLFSSSIDGTISEWDLYDLKQKTVLDSIGISIWQMALAPDVEQSEATDRLLAAACDDGCVRLYRISDLFELTYYTSLPRVSGRALSVTWSPDARRIFSGSSDGLIRCWDANLCHVVYRITVGLGTRSEICVWSLLSLRCAVLVSGDSSGTVQFWDSKYGTLLDTHSNHKGDVNTLAASPSNNRVFSAGADGQLILYKLSAATNDLESSNQKWDYIGYVKAHTHDIRALTVAYGTSRKKEKRVPMLVSAGDDAKLFVYSIQGFTKFSPHDICPAPQRVPMQMVHNSVFSQTSLLLVQGICDIDIFRIHISSDSSGRASTKPLVRVTSRGARKIICSAISNTGSLFAYSDQIGPSLFELKRNESAKSPWSVHRRKLPELPFAHSMVFSSDSSRLIIAGHDRKIYTIGINSMELLYAFTPCRKEHEGESPPREPPITKLYSSSDGQWLAAINCFGDIYIFNHETQRQHWFISRLDGASVAAAGFHPWNKNVLVISTSSNQVFAFDVEARQLGKWNTYGPGEVIGLSFSPSQDSSSVIVYSSSRTKCLIDFGKPMEEAEEVDLPNGSPRKRRFGDYQLKSKSRERKKFDILSLPSNSKHPVLFVSHLSTNSIIVIEKPWMDVVKSLDTQPVDRHIFGT